MVTALIRFVRLLSTSINFPLSKDEYANHVELRLLLFGCLDDAAPPLLWLLPKLENDTSWKQGILAAASPWELYFEATSGKHGGPKLNPNPPKDGITAGEGGMRNLRGDWPSSISAGGAGAARRRPLGVPAAVCIAARDGMAVMERSGGPSRTGVARVGGDVGLAG